MSASWSETGPTNGSVEKVQYDGGIGKWWEDFPAAPIVTGFYSSGWSGYNVCVDVNRGDIPEGLDQPPPTDESGDVDLSLIDHCLSLTMAERIEHHYHARLFAEQMRRIARQRYGSLIDDLEEAE